MLKCACDVKKPYIFVSYSHKDKKEIHGIISEMYLHGFNVWFDEGIDPASEWDEKIANQIKNAGYFIAFISKNYLASNNCKDELLYARDKGKKQLLVYIDEVELSEGLQMRLNRLQSIHKCRYESSGDFLEKIYSAEEISDFKISNKESVIDKICKTPSEKTDLNLFGVPVKCKKNGKYFLGYIKSIIGQSIVVVCNDESEHKFKYPEDFENNLIMIYDLVGKKKLLFYEGTETEQIINKSREKYFKDYYIGQKVRHFSNGKSFGVGEVKNIENGYISIFFDTLGEKKFLFPDSVSKGIIKKVKWKTKVSNYFPSFEEMYSNYGFEDFSEEVYEHDAEYNDFQNDDFVEEEDDIEKMLYNQWVVDNIE